MQGRRPRQQRGAAALPISRLLIAGLVLACGGGTATAASPGVAEAVLAAHNRERVSLRLPPLQWDARLEADAAVWAAQLARLGRLQHADEAQNPNEGENLWMGTQGAYRPVEMVGGWLDERTLFNGGMIPDASTTGKFEDVGHYTQIIWRQTTHVGCALAKDDLWDFLVCRYSPPGNFTGEYAY